MGIIAHYGALKELLSVLRGSYGLTLTLYSDCRFYLNTRAQTRVRPFEAW
jgi:hypothetical protein